MRPTRLSTEEFRDKVLGCWLGKNIGGTLGEPFEWRRQVNDVSFYTQDLGGEPLPNDDLDIQLLWLVALEEMGIDIDAHTLAEYWCLYVTPHWAEYGTGKINMRSGLMPPLCGTFQNDYKDSCGAFIRSEIWACIAPGMPAVAARYAFEDAILDHGDGEGTYAEVFCAALESAAFVVSDPSELIEIGLSYIPAECGVAQAVGTAVECYRKKTDWLKARDEILKHHRGKSHGGQLRNTSPADQEKGFADGKLGYDVPSNIAILVLGLLYGEGDFDTTMTLTVNCGEDTDCTGATVGAIFGIIYGAAGIPQKWVDPIGRKIKTACLNLGELGHFGKLLPQDVDEMTERTVRITREVLLRETGTTFTGEIPPLGCQSAGSASGGPVSTGDIDTNSLKSEDRGASIYRGMTGPTFRSRFFTVYTDYGDAPLIHDGEAKRIKLHIENTYKTQSNLTLRWRLPKGWRIAPSEESYVMSFRSNFEKPVDLEYTLYADSVKGAVNRADLEISIEGRPIVMLVAFTLLNGNASMYGGDPDKEPKIPQEGQSS